MTRFVLISDTHNKLHEMEIPSGDILIHAGDQTGRGTLDEIEEFATCFGALPHRHKCCIAGNHDWGYSKQRNLAEGILMRAGGITYLQDSEVTVEGFRVYGSPFQPRFLDWAFNVDRGPKIRKIWEKIPTGVDILITHGPPFGILDLTAQGQHVGCEDLADELKRVRPRLHVYGHVHNAYGIVEKEGTIYVNASNLNERYQVANDPIVVDLEPGSHNEPS